MIKKIVTRSLIMLFILIFTCEIGLRIRLAYLYRDPAFLLYHQFKLRSQDEIAKEKPHYYRKNMFKPFTLIYREEEPRQRKNIITIASSALRSIRRQFQKMLENNPRLAWKPGGADDNKNIEFSNNDIVLYEFLIYPDINETLKKEAGILKKILGATIDDFLYHNLVLYMHIDENIYFTTLNSDESVQEYISLLKSREEPFCRSIQQNKYRNIIYVILPNRFSADSRGGEIYLQYIKAAHECII